MHARITAVLPLALVAVAACGTTDAKKPADSAVAAAPAAATPSSAAIPVVTIEASDYAYKAPDTIPSGMMTVKLVNKGPELHHVQLVRFTGGKTYADFTAGLKQMKPGDPPPPWMETLAGPNTPVPGGTSEVMMSLEPGNYALICLIPSPDKVPHLMKGMMKPLTVVPATSAAAAAPASDVSITMTDYAWEVTPAITAGKHVIRLENQATQPHEMFIVRLEKGKTPLEMAQWTETMQGPPPGMPLGGTSGQQKGTVVYVPVDLAPGEYALMCFIPDAKDGKPHYVHGMMKAFTVS